MTTAPIHSESAVQLDGWRIDNLTLPQAADEAARLACAEEPSLVVTPNLSHLRQLRHNAPFAAAYGAAALRVADGMPLVWASKVAGNPLIECVSGSDLEPALCERLERIGGHVMYIGGRSEVINARAMARRQAEYPGLRISGRTLSMQFAEDPRETRELTAFINGESEPGQPTAVMVCAGAPRSEIWARRIMRSDANPDGVRQGVLLSVGAAIDFAAGEKHRAPEKMQKSGLEWLHRMASEPRRLGPRYARDALYLSRLLLQAAFDRVR